MESQLNLQIAQKELMERFLVNYKKTAREKKTRKFYTNRLAILKELWYTFVEGHKQITAKVYEMKASPKHGYFQKEMFTEVETSYYNTCDMIEEQFEADFGQSQDSEKNSEKSQSQSNTNDSEIRFQSNINYDSGIKLPKIELDKFNGDYRKWPTFHDLFKTLIDKNESLTQVQKLQYLKLYLVGEPEHLLRHYQVTEKNYVAAWTLLKDRYDNKRVLVNTQLKLLLSQQNISTESPQGVRCLLDTTSECLQALENLDISTKEWDPILVYLMVQKLPHDTHQLWEQEIGKDKELPTWNTLKEFLEARFRILEAVGSKKFNTSYKPNIMGAYRPKISSQQFHVTNTNSCSMCMGQHSIRKCDKFKKLNVVKRLDLAKNKGLCVNCLSSGHKYKECTSIKKCTSCNKKHHSLLHNDNFKSTHRSNQNSNSSNNYNNCNNPSDNYNNSSNNSNPHNSVNSSTPTNSNSKFSTNTTSSFPSTYSDTNKSTIATNHVLNANSNAFVPPNPPFTIGSFAVNNSTNSQILLATALVRAVAPSGHETIIRALIDQGSQVSFISEKIVQQLHLKREFIHATIQGIGRGQVHNINSRTEFKIKSLNSEASLELKALVLKKLTNKLPTNHISRHHWQFLEGLELADPQFFQPGNIDLLLGADVYSEILLQDLKRGGPETPLAQNTIFGWILSGQVPDNTTNQMVVNNFHICADLNSQLKAFWEIEEIPLVKKYNDEEILCEENYEKTTTRLSNGKYKVELPFRETNSSCYLGRSRDIAVRRLFQLENQFKRKPTLKTEYSKCLQEYISLGHMEQVEANEQKFSQPLPSVVSYQCSYLPHHAVVKETSTTTKLRVVFDASRATSSGISLNEMLLKGPTIQDDLAEILIRWRKHKIAFSADITKMYRQIWVTSEHSEYQRIVWRESANEDIKDFKLKTVTFGTKSAPYLAIRTIRKLAQDEKTKYPIAAQIAMNDFYVDDVLSGANEPDEAISIKKELENLMDAGGFPLQKWSSNCKEVVSESTNQNEINLPIDSKEDEITRALGIRWNTEKDICTYYITINTNENEWTKRKILSQIAKLFDPLGWLAPIIVLGKMIMQRLWLSNSNWDEKVGQEIETDWEKYYQNLPNVNHISINRWLQYSKNVRKVEIHGFADASTKAYAGVIYLCTTDEFGIRTASLVAAKTKVAPIKTLSLPRLELCAVTLLTKLIQYVKRALQIPDIEIFGWTDSEIVLAWLKDHPTRWTTFVANRVSHVHQILEQNVWSHVPSKQNPADCASRGLYPHQLKEHTLWWKGPEWLQLNKTHWPAKKTSNTTIEARKTVMVHLNNIEDNFENEYSSFTKLLRVVAYCIRFVTNSRKNTKKQTGYLKGNEIKNALQILIKRLQARHFSEEIQMLKSQKEIKSRSRISKLYPFLDTEGILRITGRLQQSTLSYEQKHPVILPDKDHLTNLIISKLHKETLHGGFQLMITILKEKFWLVNARNTIRQQIHKCIICFRHKQMLSEQLMGNLPSPRVQISRPFAHTGLDYCGPFELRTYKGKSAKRYKAYIAVFICMATKAMHLELVTDLTAEGFVASFRRFCARRGMCHHIYCDNGTNFVGANKILTRAQKIMLEQIDNEIAEAIENLGVEFHFNPPASPHFGGLWEAGVRSVKYHLKRVIQNQVLTYEEFITTLNQIEACLNSRPLCEVTNDENDFNALTPAHFLIGDTMLTPPDATPLNININLLTRWQHVQHLSKSFWKRWNNEYLSKLQQRPKWYKRNENIKKGELVLIKEDNLPPSRWLLARIIEVHPGPDGLIRVVTLQTKNSSLKRPVAKICRLPIHDHIIDNTYNKQHT